MELAQRSSRASSESSNKWRLLNPLERSRRVLVTVSSLLRVFIFAHPVTGLGLAVVARIVEQLGGQLRVDSKVDIGSRFSFLLPFATVSALDTASSPTTSSNGSSLPRSRVQSRTGRDDAIDNLVHALSSSHMGSQSPNRIACSIRSPSRGGNPPSEHASPKKSPLVSLLDPVGDAGAARSLVISRPLSTLKPVSSTSGREGPSCPVQLRILIVEVSLKTFCPRC